MNKAIRVLIIDDSALVRDILTKGLSSDAGIEVVGSAPDVFIGRDKIVELKPDVITLDVEMPKMDGIEFLRRLMPQFPVPVVVVSSLTQKGSKMALDALDAGAVEVVTKPSQNVAKGLADMLSELRVKIKIASSANVSHWKHRSFEHVTVNKSTALHESTDKVIAIGASTGGTEALKDVLVKLPRNMPGIVVVQHMPPGFTKLFADRLNQICQMEVKEAEDGDRVLRGRVLIAPGDFQMTVIRSGGIYQVRCTQGEKVHGHCPSVSVLMSSVAKYVGANAAGVILTGMGHDGSDGLLEMKNNNAITIGQDEQSCVVYGMPKTAFDLGAVQKELSLDKIADELIRIYYNKV